MYTLNDKLQFQARAIKHGELTLAIVHQEILDWITKQFDVRALDFLCETRETAKGLKQQVVHVVVDTVDDVKKIQTNRAGQKEVAERFLTYFKSAASNKFAADALKSDSLPPDTNPFPEIIVTCRPFKEVDTRIRQEMLDDEERAILKTFEDFWTMSQRVVFYNTDAQVKENLANGTSAKINEALVQVAKKYGFSPGGPHGFDSKEAFERDAKGDWYLYWK